MRKIIIAIAFIFAIPSGASWAATCTPTGLVRICGVADDYMSIWINGVPIGTSYGFRFVHVNCPTEGPAWGVCPTPICVMVPASSLDLADSGNVVATFVQNAEAPEMFGSWYVEIPCSEGGYTYISSDGSNTQVYRQQETGSAPSCVGLAPPGTGGIPGPGGEWTSKTFVPNGWNNAVAMTATVFTKSVIDAFGQPVPLLSNDSSANSATQCDVLFFRNTFSLGAVAPPTPTATPTGTWLTPTHTSTITLTSTRTPTRTPTITPTFTSSPSGTVFVPTSTPGLPLLVVPTPKAGDTYIYPSPVEGKTADVVYLMARPGRAKVRVYNSIGDLMARSEEPKDAGLQSTRLNVAGYAPGVYLYKVETVYSSGGGETLPVHKFVIVH